MDLGLSEKVAVVTGGSIGIGLGVARAFAREGADVAITYLEQEQEDADKVVSLVEAAGRRAVAVPGDLRDREFAKTLVEKVVDELGGLDILVNNGGKQVAQNELADIDDLAVVADLEQVPADIADDDTLPKATRRNLEILRGFAAHEPDPGARHRMEFRFYRSPVEIRGDGRVEEIVLGVNRLETGDDGRTRAVDTGERETVPTGLVLRAVGYRGLALPGVPFDDDTGTVPHTEGRIDGAEHQREYVVGWIKRGPSGIIGTNKKDANETVRHLVADLAEREPVDRPADHGESVETWLRDRCPDLVDQAGWQAIDAHERGRGEPDGRPRVKVVDREELLKLSRP